MNLLFKKKSYCFKLSKKVENSKTTYLTKLGWIIKLSSNDKKIGFGEVSPLQEQDFKKCAKQLNMIPENLEVFNLSDQINIFHPCIQSAINSALAEINLILLYAQESFLIVLHIFLSLLLAEVKPLQIQFYYYYYFLI